MFSKTTHRTRVVQRIFINDICRAYDICTTYVNVIEILRQNNRNASLYCKRNFDIFNLTAEQLYKTTAADTTNENPTRKKNAFSYVLFEPLIYSNATISVSLRKLAKILYSKEFTFFSKKPLFLQSISVWNLKVKETLETLYR